MTSCTLTSKSGSVLDFERMYLTAKYVVDNHADNRLRAGQPGSTLAAECMKCRFRLDCRVWLFRIMANALVNRGERLSLSVSAPSDSASHGSSTSPAPESSRVSESSQSIPFRALSPGEFDAAVGELPVTCKMMVALSLLERFSHREIADITGIHFGQVMSRLRQGRDMIRQNYSTLWRASTIDAPRQLG